MDTDFLSVEDVAKHLKLKPRSVHELLRLGSVRGVKIGKHWRVRPADLAEYESMIFANANTFKESK